MCQEDKKCRHIIKRKEQNELEKVIRRRDDTSDDWSYYIDSTYCIESIKSDRNRFAWVTSWLCRG